MEFGKKLREFRIENGFTQKQLAIKLRVAESSIRDWESRGRQPSYEILCELTKIFDITVGQLLGVEEYL